MIQTVLASTTNIDNANISLPPSTANTLQLIGGSVVGGALGDSITIPLGAYEVTVHNVGLTDIQVGGATLGPDDSKTIKGRENPTNNRFDFTPAITIVVPQDGKAYYEGERPST
ncbi:MAG: hypothetical protein AAFU67_15210 [Bacteroidota bacterium]